VTGEAKKPGWGQRFTRQFIDPGAVGSGAALVGLTVTHKGAISEQKIGYRCSGALIRRARPPTAPLARRADDDRDAS
jgi:hypothetical protein